MTDPKEIIEKLRTEKFAKKHVPLIAYTIAAMEKQEAGYQGLVDQFREASRECEELKTNLRDKTISKSVHDRLQVEFDQLQSSHKHASHGSGKMLILGAVIGCAVSFVLWGLFIR